MKIRFYQQSIKLICNDHDNIMNKYSKCPKQGFYMQRKRCKKPNQKLFSSQMVLVSEWGSNKRCSGRWKWVNLDWLVGMSLLFLLINVGYVNVD